MSFARQTNDHHLHLDIGISLTALHEIAQRNGQDALKNYAELLDLRAEYTFTHYKLMSLIEQSGPQEESKEIKALKKTCEKLIRKQSPLIFKIMTPHKDITQTNQGVQDLRDYSNNKDNTIRRRMRFQFASQLQAQESSKKWMWAGMGTALIALAEVGMVFFDVWKKQQAAPAETTSAMTPLKQSTP